MCQKEKKEERKAGFFSERSRNDYKEKRLLIN